MRFFPGLNQWIYQEIISRTRTGILSKIPQRNLLKIVPGHIPLGFRGIISIFAPEIIPPIFAGIFVGFLLKIPPGIISV